jgi:hypothetical protein
MIELNLCESDLDFAIILLRNSKSGMLKINDLVFSLSSSFFALTRTAGPVAHLSRQLKEETNVAKASAR